MATDLVAYGLYPNRESFERALEALRAANFRNSDISAILPDRDHRQRIVATRSTPRHQKALRPARAPAPPWAECSGGCRYRRDCDPGIGPLVAAGPWSPRSLARVRPGRPAGWSAASSARASRRWRPSDMPDGSVRAPYLLSVHCDDGKWAKKAEDILERTGGKDVVKTAEAQADYRP